MLLVPLAVLSLGLAPAPTAAQTGSDGYAQFASRESGDDKAPVLIVDDGRGEPRRLVAVADAPLLSYLPDRAFPTIKALPAGYQDRCQTLLRFELPKDLALDDLVKAELVLTTVPSPRPPQGTSKLTLQLVTAPWREAVTWKGRPKVDERPLCEAGLEPGAAELRFVVTHVVQAWLARPAANHGVLLRLPGGAPHVDGTMLEQKLVASIGFADGPEAARQQAGKQGLLVLGLVVGTYGDKLPVDVEVLLATAFQEPALRELVARRFVPVLVRVRPTAYLNPRVPQGRPGQRGDDVSALGLEAADLKPPALVVATPAGKAIDRLESIGAYDAGLVRAFLVRAANEGLALWPDPETPVDELLARGMLDVAAERIAALPEAERALPSARLAWLRDEPARVRELVRGLPEAHRAEAALLDARAAMRLGDATAARATLEKLAAAGGDEADPEVLYRLAWLRHRAGDRDGAVALWKRLAGGEPTPGWSMRAAARLAWPERLAWAEDFAAPFVALGAGTGTECSVDRKQLGGLADHAVGRLLAWQAPDGSWPIEVDDYRGAVTAFAAKALLAWRGRLGDERGAAIDAALARADAWIDDLLGHDPVTSSTFGQTYALDYLVARHAAAEGEAREAAAERVRRGVRFLLGGQCPNGAWSYSKGFGTRWRGGFGGWPKTTRGRAHSMNTGPALVALQMAEAAGFEVDAEAMKRGLDVLEEMRFGAGAYTYTFPDPISFQRSEQSIARGPVCEQALEQGGRVAPEALAKALATFVELRAGLRRPVKLDESWASLPGYSSYFFHYAYYHAALALRRLATHADHRKQAAEGLAAIGADLLAVVERDGSWIDYPQLGKPYGTAAALCVLAEAFR
ncbi:MAG: DNRLRE domain-containing protein [Planctomycetota bacterium]